MGASSLVDKEEWDVPQPSKDLCPSSITRLPQSALSFHSTSSAQSMWSSFICPLSTDQRRSCGISTRCRGPSGASTSIQGSSTTTSVRMTSVIAQMLIQVTHDHECKFSIEYRSPSNITQTTLRVREWSSSICLFSNIFILLRIGAMDPCLFLGQKRR